MFFLWCYVRNINPSNEHPGRILKVDKKLASNLNYDKIKFPVTEKDFKKIEIQNNICINVFSYENNLVFPIYISDKKFEDSMDLLLLIDDDQSHCSLKTLTDLCFTKQKIKIKNGFVEVVYNALVVKMC